MIKVKKEETIRENGITLVALVITIIILLILAGISIANLTQTGLFEKAQEAKEKTENAQAEENAILENYLAQINEITGNGYEKTLTDTSDTKPAQAKPAGTTVIESDLSKGIVIKDNSKNNEWTWVVVPKSIYSNPQYTVANENRSVTSETDYEGIYNILNKYASPYREGKAGQGRYWTDEWYYWENSSSTLYGYVEKIIADETEYEQAVSAGNLYINRAGIEATSGRYNINNKYYERNTNLTEEQAKNTTANSGLSLSDYTSNYKKMLSSVYTNGGFWISRYEAGIAKTNTDTTRETISPVRYVYSAITSESTDAVSQANRIPYNYVKCSEAQSLAGRMSPDTSKTCSLLFGIQWDLVCKYLEENTDLEIVDINSNSATKNWGNYANNSITLKPNSRYCTSPSSSSGTWALYTVENDFITLSNNVYKTNNDTNYKGLLTTGASEDANKMNIYDFAGNEWEFTLEHATSNSNYPCAYRGGSYYNTGSGSPASYRSDNTTSNSYSLVGFRSTLY